MEGADAQMSWIRLADFDTQMDCHCQRRFMAQGREEWKVFLSPINAEVAYVE